MGTTPQVTRVSPAEGSMAGNLMVTITGSGFTGATAVNFGSAGGTHLQVLSDSVITVTNPDTGTPGPVDVTVMVNANASPATTASRFHYMAPQVTGLNPSSGALAGGDTITVSGRFLTGAAAVNFGKAGASNLVVLSDTGLTVTNPNAPNQGPVDVFVIVQGQSSSACTADQFTYSNALAPGVPILFAAESPETTFIQFIGDANLEGSYYDSLLGTMVALAPNTAYALSTLASSTPVAPNLPNGVPAVLVNAFSGRLYINFGSQGLIGMSPSYTPDAANPGDTNYTTRYQYFEPTIAASQLNVDLSYIDFTAISLSLTTGNAPHATNSPQLSQASLQLATAAGNAATPANASVLPAAMDQLPNSAFARVISPQLAKTFDYHDFTHYLQTTLGANKATVRIAGTYVGTGAQPSGNPLTQAQSYDYLGSFDSDGNVSLVPQSDSGNGYAPGVPTVQQGPGVGSATGNIVIAFPDLNAQTGIYGCNAPYTLGNYPKTTGITNDVYGQVVGDLLAGLDFGYVGSAVECGGVAIGSLASTQWWGGTLPNGTVVTSSSTPGGQGLYFGSVQANPLDYNTYAGSISTLTSGYGFPLQDRLGRNLLTMNTDTDPGSYLLVWVDVTPTS